ncbi:MAG: dTDP-4-dehydrorhamnose reductase [Minwuia sp.]|nr:dTDP-4-dehydrorhamnose reductase [Minwuia sp.]
MSILVLGAGGQVGAALRWRAMARGQSVIGLKHDELDITIADAVRRTVADIRPSIVINCAAHTAVDRAEEEPERAMAINGEGAGNVALSCALASVPLIHLSTDYVFDGSKTGPYREDDPIAPATVYGRTKLAGERAVFDAWGKHVILRTSWVFGAMGSNFVKTMLRLAASGQSPLKVVDDQIGGPTPADAIADACLDITTRVLQADIVPWGTYHFAGAPTVSWHGFAQAILAHYPDLVIAPCTTEDFPRPAPRPANSVLDCGRIRAAFGIGQPDWTVHLAHLLRDLGEMPTESGEDGS